MLDMNGTKGKNIHEFDFIIVNYTHQYIMNIEVKKWLGKIQNKDIDIGKEVREQLEKRKKLMEDWFSADLKGIDKYFSPKKSPKNKLGITSPS